MSPMPADPKRIFRVAAMVVDELVDPLGRLPEAYPLAAANLPTFMQEQETNMGAPSPELWNLWLARAFNAQDVEAATALYDLDASIVQVDDVHGGTSIARGSDGIRKTMADYIDLNPHMDVVTHHTTVAGGIAMTRSQWVITGTDNDGRQVEVHHHGIEVHRRLPDGTWVCILDHPFGADPSWAIEVPPHTE